MDIPHHFNFQLQRLMIGATTILLPIWLLVFCKDLPSISDSYHSGARDLFVGVLIGVGVLLIPYRGRQGEDPRESWLAKLGGISAIVVAVIPTECPGVDDVNYSCLIESACGSANNLIHFSAAAVLFGCMLYISAIFNNRARKKAAVKNNARAGKRSLVYKLCVTGMSMGFVIAILNALEIKILGDTTLFWAEFVMLVSFSVSWLTASQILFLGNVQKTSGVAIQR